MSRQISKWDRFLCWLGIHDWVLINTERRKIRLFKELYEANGWNQNYKICTYECSRCKKWDSQNG